MNFDLSIEQLHLRQAVERYLGENYTFSARQAVAALGPFKKTEHWSAFANVLGLLGVAIPERMGGLGGGAIENMIVMEAFGRALVTEPFLASSIVGAGFLKHGGCERAEEIAAGVTRGDVVIAFAQEERQSRYDFSDIRTTARRNENGWVLNGEKTLVLSGPLATHFTVVARTSGAQRDTYGISLFLIGKDVAGIRRQDYPTADGHSASQIIFDEVQIAACNLIGIEHNALPLIRHVADEATAALCAEAVGCMRELLERTVSYCLQRRQFGQPLAQFQALQHRIADMYVALEQSVSAVLLATLKLEESERERIRAVSTAKVIVGKALRFIGQNAVQLHGGMGVTEELALGHYFRRATMIESLFGSADHHVERFLSQGDSVAAVPSTAQSSPT